MDCLPTQYSLRFHFVKVLDRLCLELHLVGLLDGPRNGSNTGKNFGDGLSIWMLTEVPVKCPADLFKALMQLFNLEVKRFHVSGVIDLSLVSSSFIGQTLTLELVGEFVAKLRLRLFDVELVRQVALDLLRFIFVDLIDRNRLLVILRNTVMEQDLRIEVPLDFRPITDVLEQRIFKMSLLQSELFVITPKFVMAYPVLSKE